MPKTVTPSLGLDSFTCPHCGALAHQYWRKVFIKGYDRNGKPEVLSDPDFVRMKALSTKDSDERKRLLDLSARFSKNLVTFEQLSYGEDCRALMLNVSAAWCHSCEGFSLWVLGKLIFPQVNDIHSAHDDTPSDVRADFEEAAAILDKSPRGAAALLRLALQKLMIHLGEKGNNLNADIGNLVAKGLDPVIQQALDVVRVVGNNAVHPGQIELNDNTEIAGKLFILTNVIVASMISAKKQIAQLFDELPDGAKKAIEKRDTPKKSFLGKASPAPSSTDESEPA